jgi:hypothetical protein
MRRAVRFLAFLSAAAGLSAVGDTDSARQEFPVRQVLDYYESGNHAGVSAALDAVPDMHRMFRAFERDANSWITEDGIAAARWRRQLIAASVALEVGHRLRGQPPEQAARYLVWASLAMRRNPPATPSETERLWYLASIAGMLEQSSPWVLTAAMPTGSSALQSLVRRLGPGGHLTVAAQRFPDEPRFRLLGVAAQEWRLRVYRFIPSYLDQARLRVEGRVSDESSSTALADAREVLRQFVGLSEIRRAYDALAEVASLRAEVHLRVGWLESAALNWTAALDHFGRVPVFTDEVYLEYLSHYFSGLVFQRVGNRAEALAAFDRAAELMPNARSAATSLAAELLLSDRAGDRDRGYVVLQAAYSPGAPDDPWRLYFCGDARLWPAYMARLRQALQ